MANDFSIPALRTHEQYEEGMVGVLNQEITLMRELVVVTSGWGGGRIGQRVQTHL